jgi:hypothetical protein
MKNRANGIKDCLRNMLEVESMKVSKLKVQNKLKVIQSMLPKLI